MEGGPGGAAGLLTVSLPCRWETLQDVSFTVMPGQTLALVREDPAICPASSSSLIPVPMAACDPGCGVREPCPDGSQEWRGQPPWTLERESLQSQRAWECFSSVSNVPGGPLWSREEHNSAPVVSLLWHQLWLHPNRWAHRKSSQGGTKNTPINVTGCK